MNISLKNTNFYSELRHCTLISELFSLIWAELNDLLTLSNLRLLVCDSHSTERGHFYQLSANNSEKISNEPFYYQEQLLFQFLLHQSAEFGCLTDLEREKNKNSFFYLEKNEILVYYQLFSRKKNIGVLFFTIPEEKFPGEQRLKNLNDFINLFSLALDNLLLDQQQDITAKKEPAVDLLLVNNIGKKTIGSLRIPELLDHIISYLTKQINFDRVILLLKSKDNQTDYEGMIGTIENKQKYILGNLKINNIPSLNELKHLLKNNQDLQNIIDPVTFTAFPLIIRGEVSGILAVDNYYKKRAISEKELNILELIVSQINVAIDNASLYEDMKMSALGFKQLFEVASSFNTILDYEQAARVIVEQISSSIGVSQAYLISFEIENYCKVISSVNEHNNFVNNDIELTKPLRQAIVSKRPVLYDHEKHLRSQCLDLKYSLIVPMYIKNKLTGILCLGETDETEKRIFSEHDIRLVQTIANQAAVTLENAQLYNKLEDMVVERTVDLIDSNKALQKQKEELEQVSQRLKAIISSIPDGIIVINKNNLIISINPAFEKIIRYHNEKFMAEEVIGLPLLKIADLIDKQSKDFVNIYELLAVISQKEIDETKEFDFVMGNKTPHYYKVLPASFSFGYPGEKSDLLYEKLGGKVIVFHDITKEKEIDKLKSDFTAVVSHELKTPVSAMIGFATIIEDGIAGEVNQQQIEYLNKIHSQGERLIRLINDLLDFSRLEAGQMPLYIQLLDSGEVITEVVEILRPLADEKNMRIEALIEPELPPIFVDPDKLKQILINLIGNAIKFTPENTGLIQIGVSLNSDHTDLIFSVKDNGIGIPEKDQEKLFDRFYQVDNSSTRKYGGTGLGLAIVKKLLDLNNGNIWLESQPGNGTCFYFNIPLDKKKLH